MLEQSLKPRKYDYSLMPTNSAPERVRGKDVKIITPMYNQANKWTYVTPKICISNASDVPSAAAMAHTAGEISCCLNPKSSEYLKQRDQDLSRSPPVRWAFSLTATEWKKEGENASSSMEKLVGSTKLGRSSAAFTRSRSKRAATAISSSFRRSAQVSILGMPSKRVTLRECLKKQKKYCNIHNITSFFIVFIILSLTISFAASLAATPFL